MKKLLLLMLGLATATAAVAEETSDVNYGQSSGTVTLDLIWKFDYRTYNEQTCAVITGVRNSGGATVTGDIAVPETVSVTNAAGEVSAFIVKGIAADTFKNQLGITSISVSRYVEDIGTPFCTGCSALSAITVDDNNFWFAANDGLLFDREQETLIACPPALDAVQLPYTTTTIGARAFEGCFRLKTLEIPDAVTDIGDRAFANAKRLKSVTFNGSLPTSGADLFAGSDAVTVYIPKGDATWPAVWHGRTLEYSSGSVISGVASETVNKVTWFFRVVDGQAELYNNGQPCIGTGVSTTYTLDLEKGAWVADGALNIPSSLGGYPVTRIGDNAFRNCSALVDVRLPETVTFIGDTAFRNCGGIKTLTIPNSVRSIGYHPFEGSAMTKLALPDSLRELDGNPMAGCENFLSVTIGQDNSFFTVVNGLLYDKDVKLLIGCPARQEGATIAATCTTIGPEAFAGCFRVSSLIIPEYVVRIGTGAFVDMPRLASLVFPASVRTLEGAGLFAGCGSLGFVGFSGDAPSVDEDLLLGTADAIKVYVSQGTRGWNGDPESSALPADGKWPLTGDNRRVIENLDVSAEADLKEGDVFTIINTNGTMFAWTMKVLANKGLEILAVSPKPTGSFEIPNEFSTVLGTMTVKLIGDRLLANATGLLSVSFPNTVTNIGDEVFLNCDVLSAVTLANGLRSIGRHAFSGSAVETIALPNTVNAIDGNLLAGCSPSTGITVGDANPYFAVSAQGVLYDKDFTTLFAVPSTVEEIEIPASVTDFAEECFLGCLRLKKVTFLGDAPTAFDGDDLYLDAHAVMTNFVIVGNTTFGPVPGFWHLRPVVAWGEAPVEEEGEFKYRIVNGYAEIYNNGDAAIKTTKTGAVTIPGTLGGYPVTRIGEGAFRNCANIDTVSIPSTVTEIGDEAFYGCESLTSVELPANTAALGRRPFFGTSIESLELPAKLKSLDGSPVAGCDYLDTITVSAKSKTFLCDGDVLYDIRKQKLIACQSYATEVTVPASVVEIGADAFSCCTFLAKVTFEGNAPSCADGLYADCEDVTSYVTETATGFTTGTWMDRPIVVLGSSSDDDPPGRQEFTDDDGNVWLYTVEGGKAKLGHWGSTPVLKNPDVSGVVKIPDTLDGYPLTAIPDRAFENCANVTVFDIPASITAIGEGAFNGCTALEEIKVDPANTNYRSRFGTLCSKDGKTLVKVPAKFDFDRKITSTATGTEKTWRIINPYYEIVGGSPVLRPATTNVLSIAGQQSATTVSNHLAAISQETLFTGVTAVANYAFTDCGNVTLEDDVTSVLVLKAQAIVAGNRTGVEQTVIEGVVTHTLDEPLTIPATVTSVGEYATWNSGFTAVSNLSSEPVIPALGGIAAALGVSDPKLDDAIDTEAKLADFNTFLRSAGVTDPKALTSAQKTHLLESYELSAVTPAPILLTDTPVVTIDRFEQGFETDNMDLRVSLKAGSADIVMAKEKIRDMIKVGPSLDAMNRSPKILASPDTDGSTVYFTVTAPDELAGSSLLLYSVKIVR